MLNSCYKSKEVRWPRIKEVCFNHHFEQNISNRLFVTIESQNGKPLYRLDVRYLPEIFDDVLPYDYDYSGMLHGRLYSIYTEKETYPNIFMSEEHATRDWECYSRFLEVDVINLVDAPMGRKLVQGCKARGMKIFIEIYNVKLDQDLRVSSFNFNIKFTNDTTAKNTIAQPILRL